MRRRLEVAGLVFAVLVVSGVWSGGVLSWQGKGADAAQLRAGEPGAPFEFALIGDTRYTAEQRAKFPNLLADINAHPNLAFTVHDGDIKAGSDACLDSIYLETKDLFNQFNAPLIFTPGDNDWTDCHRAGGDSLERLAFERRLFFPDNQSMGKRKMTLQQQEGYPENARWTYGGVMFATLNIQGSNNNLGRNAENDQEYIKRNIANLNWMSQTFDSAKANGSIAVMIVWQANPWDTIPANQLTGFGDQLRQMERDVIAFGKPVVLVHGDSHYFRIDKPLMGTKSKRRIENFTRVETFGTDDVHWLRVTVDANDPNVFTFRPQIVTANLVNHN